MMTTHRVVKSVLYNYLNTYTSRYSEFRGYWLFGFLVGNLMSVEFNLLERDGIDSDTPLGVATALAEEKFLDQVRKSGLDPLQVVDARLRIERQPGTVAGFINGRQCDGCNVSFRAAVVTDDGKRYEREQVVFIAPHDARVEYRSARDA